MAKYRLQPNEVVLLKDDSVMHGGVLSSYTDELTLTNLNLVLTKKGIFGNSKALLIFPLTQIKVHDQVAQASIGTNNGTAVLDVYFLDGEQRFNFQSGGKKKIQSWIVEINRAATGRDLPELVRSGMALPGSEIVAGVLRDTFGVFKSKLGAPPAAIVSMAGKCTSCGAPIGGTRGQIITCNYCGSAQQL